jgi:hypothetical protein
MPSAMVKEGIKHLCDEMPTMPGCTVQRVCADEAKKVGASPYCNEFSILKGFQPISASKDCGEDELS